MDGSFSNFETRSVTSAPLLLWRAYVNVTGAPNTSLLLLEPEEVVPNDPSSLHAVGVEMAENAGDSVGMRDDGVKEGLSDRVGTEEIVGREVGALRLMVQHLEHPQEELGIGWESLIVRVRGFRCLETT